MDERLSQKRKVELTTNGRKKQHTWLKGIIGTGDPNKIEGADLKQYSVIYISEFFVADLYQ